MIETEKALTRFKTLKQKLSALTSTHDNKNKINFKKTDPCPPPHNVAYESNVKQIKLNQNRPQKHHKKSSDYGKQNLNVQNCQKLGHLNRSQIIKTKEKQVNEKSGGNIKFNLDIAKDLLKKSLHGSDEQFMRKTQKKAQSKIRNFEQKPQNHCKTKHIRTKSGGISKISQTVHLQGQNKENKRLQSLPHTQQKKMKSLQNSNNRAYMKQFNDSIQQSPKTFENCPQTAKFKIVSEIDELIRFKQQILANLESKLGVEKCFQFAKMNQTSLFQQKQKKGKEIRAPNLYQMQFEGRKQKSRSKDKRR